MTIKDKNSTPFAVLSQQQINALSSAASGLSKDQLIWTSGFFAGMASAGVNSTVSEASTTPAASEDTPSLTILYGSQTGNAKGVAIGYKDKAEKIGFKTNIVSMADYKPRQLKSESHLVVVVSTHGEGDAPDDAMELHEFLSSKKASKLPNLKYSVVGLGDTSYEFFCQTAKDFDSRLQSLGATALIPRLDCDVDYDEQVDTWASEINEVLKTELMAVANDVLVTATTQAANSVAEAVYSKKSPFTASLIESLKITGRDSVKDIRHIEISLEDSNIIYQPGDALGVWFANDEELVKRVISTLSLNTDESVSVQNETLSLYDALMNKLELTLSYPGFIKAYQEASGNKELAKLLEDKARLKEYLAFTQTSDIIFDYPVAISAQALVDAMRPLTPRLYSIASSQAEVEDEVHLTVAHVAYDAHGRYHQGGASGFLSTRLTEGDGVKVYVESNDNFRLPTDPKTPIIMVGPGTGIAPFRAFMQERDVTEAEGKNWLFFGNPTFTQDFLYQTEWQGYVKSGLLSNISLAFSRDQKEKIYVQDRMLENAEELFLWLEQGAHVYVCGDALRMAKDVEQALLSIIQEQGGKSEDDAKQYLTAMRKAKRYQKDVY